MRDQLLLQLRDAIADKEWTIAAANHDTAKFGAWQCDWYADMRRNQEQIDHILGLLKDHSC